MIEQKIDCTQNPGMKIKTDFNRYGFRSENVDIFTRDCGVELLATLLSIIVKAEDEYTRIIQTKCRKKMSKKGRLEVGGFLMGYVKEIDEDLIRKYRREVIEKTEGRVRKDGEI